MSKHTSNGSEGSDGSWFLEAVGAKSKSPSPIESVAELEAENTRPDTPIVPASDATRPFEVSFDGNPGTSTSSFDPVPSPPPPPDLEDPVTEELAIGGSPDASDDADDALLPRALRSRRRFRWPVVIVLVVLIAATATAILWLPRTVDNQALATRQDYYDAAVELRNYLPTAQTALDAITNPAADEAAVSASVPIVAELDTRAFDLEAVTTEPLPSAPPFVPTDAIDALEPLRFEGSLHGAEASNIAHRLGDAYVFRTSIPLLMDAGPLPDTASTQEVNEVSVRLAESLAADAALIADLPDDPSFEGVLAEAQVAFERYGFWQEEYLEALTSEDTDMAADLVDELERTRSELVSADQEALIAFRAEADSLIVGLAANLERYMADLTTP